MATPKPTLKLVLNRLKAWADSHTMITDFKHGVLPEINKGEKRTNWILMYVVIQDMAIVRTGMELNFDIVFAAPTKQNPDNAELDLESEKQVQSDILQICQDLIAEFHNGSSYFAHNGDPIFELGENFRAQALSFTEQHAQWVTGFTLVLNLIATDALDACSIPYIGAYNPAPPTDCPECPELKVVKNTGGEILTDTTPESETDYTIKDVDILDGAATTKVIDLLTTDTIFTLTGMAKSFLSGKDYKQEDNVLTIIDYNEETLETGERLKIDAAPRYGQNWNIKLVTQGFNVINSNGTMLTSVSQGDYILTHSSEDHITLVLRVAVNNLNISDGALYDTEGTFIKDLVAGGAEEAPDAAVRDSTGVDSEILIVSGGLLILADIPVKHSDDSGNVAVVPRLADNVHFPRVDLKIGGASNVYESTDFTITGGEIKTMTRDIDDLVGGGGGTGIAYRQTSCIMHGGVTHQLYDHGWLLQNGWLKTNNPVNPEYLQELDMDAAVPFKTLKHNNIHGNKFRWTKRNGTEWTEPANSEAAKINLVCQDHLLGREFVMNNWNAGVLADLLVNPNTVGAVLAGESGWMGTTINIYMEESINQNVGENPVIFVTRNGVEHNTVSLRSSNSTRMLRVEGQSTNLVTTVSDVNVVTGGYYTFFRKFEGY